MKQITFEETPKMSTYLIALVISDFTSVKDGVEKYEVWARQNAVENGKFALSLMKPLVGYYEGILHISYHLRKLDMVALPDFVSGAMENWGLLTYKERNLLFDSQLSTTASKQSIANVIAHEIAHQWFGNLVSPKWWKYLWLNEGFARYFQYFAIHHVSTCIFNEFSSICQLAISIRVCILFARIMHDCICVILMIQLILIKYQWNKIN